MDFFHTMRLFCLVGTGLSAAVSAVLFVRLEIRAVIGYLSGNRAVREIRKMEAKTEEEPVDTDGTELILRKERTDEKTV